MARTFYKAFVLILKYIRIYFGNKLEFKGFKSCSDTFVFPF